MWHDEFFLQVLYLCWDFGFIILSAYRFCCKNFFLFTSFIQKYLWETWNIYGNSYKKKNKKESMFYYLMVSFRSMMLQIKVNAAGWKTFRFINGKIEI